jgi:RHS repeat-associated protein
MKLKNRIVSTLLTLSMATSWGVFADWQVAFAQTPADIYIEAESGVLTAPFAAVNDSTASNGQYIVETTLSANCAAGTTTFATYSFNIAAAGVYRVWGRTIAPNSGADSFCVQIDSGTLATWTVPQSASWTWNKVLDTTTFSLSAGTHTLKIGYREANTKLDKLIITSNMSFTPSGLGALPGGSKVLAKPAQQAGAICSQYGIARNGCVLTQYFMFGGKRVAVRTMTDANPTGSVTWLHGDHLGSSTVSTGPNGAVVGRARYTPFGSTVQASGDLNTPFKFTGQREFGGIGLYDYNARFYNPLIGRFISPDTIVPGAGNSQAFNRYAYTFNNPMRYTDPSGHCPKPTGPGAIICIAAFIPTAFSNAGPKSYTGDDRSFSSNSQPDQSRMWMWVDAKSGEVLQVSFHDTVSETGTVYRWKDNPRKNHSYVDSSKSLDGTINVRYAFYCADPDLTCAAGPKGEMSIKPVRDKSGRVTRFAGSLRARPFPNLEAYYWEDGKLVATIFNVENFPASERRAGRASDLTGIYGMWLGDPPNTMLFTNENLDTYWYYDSTTDREDYRANQRR